jgi:hypothetical protein
MKPNKTAFLAVVMVLAFGISDAQTIPFPGPVTKAFEPEPLNFSLVASQTAYIDTPISTNYSRIGTNVFTEITISSTAVITNSMITSKKLLSFLATAFNTNWPEDVQLALDHWTGDIFVVDKTGTNPICDVSVGINFGDTDTTYFRCTAGSCEVYADKPVVHNRNNNNISYRQTSYAKVFFHLFSEQNGITYTDLNFDGLDKTDFQADKNNIIIQSDEASVTGDGHFTDGLEQIGTLEHMIVITGQMTGSGQWYSPPVQAQPLSGELK